MYIITHIIILFKFIILLFAKLMLFSLASKIFLNFLVVYLITLILKYPHKRFNKLSLLKKYKNNLIFMYAIKTKKQNLYNIVILIFGFLLFFIAILLLRFYNYNKTINIVEKSSLIYKLYLQTTLFDFILTCILFSLLVSTYILILLRIANYIKFHAIKRHLYLVGNEDTFDCNRKYVLIFLVKFIDVFNLYKIIFKLCYYIIPDLYKILYFKHKTKVKPPLFEDYSTKEKEIFYMKSPVDPTRFVQKFYIDKILLHLFTKWHYVLLVILLLHDCYYNNHTIHSVFTVLPWTFLYDVYLRTSKFFDGFHLAYDTYINTVLYANKIEILTEDDWLIDGEFYNLKNFKHIYATYVCKGFIKDVHTLCL